MRIFVTGGSGFVGGHVIERLGGEHELVAMARSDRSAAVVEGFGATAVRCSLDDVGPEHLQGVDVVVHAAAFVEEYGTRAQFEAINVHGTQRLLDAAREAGVRRFVHIGTEAVLFTGEDLVDVDETAQIPSAQRFLYSETKAAAEQRVLAANQSGFTTLSLRPSFIWGPRDNTVVPGMRRMVDEGSFAWIDGGEHLHSTTHVYNLVAAIETALTQGQGGEAYFIADDEVRTFKQFLTSLAAHNGITLPERNLPGWLLRPVGRFLEGSYRTLGIQRTPPITGFTAAVASRQVTVCTDKAKAQLGWRPVLTLEQGLTTLAA